MPHVVNLRKSTEKEESTAPVLPTSYTSIQKSKINSSKKPQELLSSFDDKRIYWQTHVHHRQSPGHYFVFLVILLLATGGVIYYFQREMLLPIMLGLSAITLILQTAKKSEIVDAEVSPAGVTWANQTHYYKDLHSFWIEYNPAGIKELSLRTQKWYLPHIKIPLENQNPIQIRTIMIEYLPEEEHEQGLIDSLSRRI